MLNVENIRKEFIKYNSKKRKENFTQTTVFPSRQKKAKFLEYSDQTAPEKPHYSE